MIRIIASIDRKRGIAKQGFQPWDIPEDRKYFSAQTRLYGSNVLMGSTTYKVLGGPLPDRDNFILTRDKEPIEGVELVHDLDKFLLEWSSQDLWIIGGANVYSQVMETGRADELYLTKIEADFGCNQFFPEFEEKFELKDQSSLHEQNGFIFSFTTYVRKQK